MTELLNGFLSGSAAWGVLLTLAAFAPDRSTAAQRFGDSFGAAPAAEG